MKTLIVYATFFGNTEKVAKMIHSEFKPKSDVLHVNEIHDITSYDLIVIGSPTRGFRPTKPVVELVRSLSLSPHQSVAFFDTRIDPLVVNQKFVRKMMKWFGYANDTLEKIATKKQLDVIIPSGEFFVKDSEGPLVENTEEDVRTWVQLLKTHKEENQ